MPDNSAMVDRTKSTRASPFILRIVLFVLVVSLYLGLVYYFKTIDFYHRDFFEKGQPVIIYNIFRLFFVANLVWLIYFIGESILTALCGARSVDGLRTAERFVTGFFAGAGVLHVVLLGVGLAGYLTAQAAIIGTTVLLIVSCPRLAELLGSASTGLRLQRPRMLVRLLDPWAMMFLLLGAAAMLVLVKGLYPAGGHDYYTHYFYYYTSVVELGSVRPNDVWYHFFYSKGAGLFFLAMLITDPLAPQLVTLAFVLVAAVSLFLLLRQSFRGGLWPWVGAVGYLCLYVYTPGPLNSDFAAHGGWGDFEKHHEIIAASCITLVWLSANALSRADETRPVWTLGLLLTVALTVIVTQPFAPFVGAFFLLLLFIFAARRRWPEVLVCFLAAAAAAIILLIILLINYILTGVFTDQLVRPLWQFIDLEKVKNWGVLFEILRIHWGQTGMVANQLPLDRDAIQNLLLVLRLDLLAPLLVGGLMTLATAWKLNADKRATSGGPAPSIAPRIVPLTVFGFIATSSVLALMYGRHQPISLYRFSSFMYPLAIAAAILLWLPFDARLAELRSSAIRYMLPLLFGALTLWWAHKSFNPSHVSSVWTNATNFISGRFSLRDAYQNQQGWPGRLPWGGIYPAMEQVWRIVGRKTPVWSFHIHSYCMLPDCRIESYLSFKISSDWDRIMYGTPAQARTALEASNINYFFISDELAITDIFPHAELFAPRSIAEHLAVKWSDGTSYLLTWPGPGTTPIGEHFLSAYREQVGQSPTVTSFPKDALETLFEKVRSTPPPLRPFPLPW